MNPQKRKDLLDIIAGAFASGMNDHQVRNILQNSQTVMTIGHMVGEEDLIALIRDHMMEKPGQAIVCTECEHARKAMLENYDRVRLTFPSYQSSFPNGGMTRGNITMEMSRVKYENAVQIAAEWIRKNMKISGIKELRVLNGWGLKETKFFVDAVEAGCLQVQTV